MVSSWRRTLAATASRLRRSWSIWTVRPVRVVASLAAGAVLVDDGAQVGPPVEGGAADPGAGGYVGEGDGLPGGGQLGAGGLDPGQLVVVSWHGPG